MAEGELELGAEERERRPQLVAGIRDEVPLALERASSRASIAFSVSPSRSTSSRVCGTGSRSPGVSAEISAARRRIDSTGLSASPARR